MIPQYTVYLSNSRFVEYYVKERKVMKTSKKILSFFLAVVMVVTTCSVGFTAFAAEKNGSIWSTDADADAAYTALEALVDEFLPSALMGIEAVRNGVYEKYAHEKGWDPYNLDDEQKAQIDSSVTTRDILAALSQVIYSALGSTSQQQFANAMEGNGADASHYDYLQGKSGSLDFFTLYTLCRDGKDNNDYSSDTRKTLAEWYEKLHPLATKYLEAASNAESDMARFEKIVSDVVEKVSKSKYDVAALSLYEMNKLVPTIMDGLDLSDNDQTIISTYLAYYNDYLAQMDITAIEITSVADYVYYMAGLETTGAYLTMAAQYYPLLQLAEANVTFKGKADLGFGEINADITENITIDNFDALFAQEYIDANYNGNENAFYGAVINKTADEVANDPELKEAAKSSAKGVFSAFFAKLILGDDFTPNSSDYYTDYLIGLSIQSGVYKNRAEVEAAVNARTPEITDADRKEMTYFFTILISRNNNTITASPYFNKNLQYPYSYSFYDDDGAENVRYTLPENLQDTAFSEYMYLVQGNAANQDYRQGFFRALIGDNLFNNKYDITGNEERDSHGHIIIPDELIEFDEVAFQTYINDVKTYAYGRVAEDALDSIGVDSNWERDSNKAIQSVFNIESAAGNMPNQAMPELPVNVEFTDEEQKTFDDVYSLANDMGAEIVNTTINDTVSGIVGNSIVSGLLEDFLDSDVDLESALDNLWQRLYDSPVSTIVELIPLVAVFADEMILPLVFNQEGDITHNVIANFGETEKIGALMQFLGLDMYFNELTFDWGSFIGIAQVGWDLNEVIPTLMTWLLASKEDQKAGNVEGMEYYESKTVELLTVQKKANGDIIQDDKKKPIPQTAAFTQSNFGSIDFDHYTVKDADGNELTRGEDGKLTYNGSVYNDAAALFAANESAVFNCYMTYSSSVPRITNIYYVDQLLGGACIEDLSAMIGGAIGSDNGRAILSEIITEAATLFDAAVDEFVSTPEYRNETKYRSKDGTSLNSGLNNLAVAVPRLLDIMENLAAEKYGVDENAWVYCYEGKIYTKEISGKTSTHNATLDEIKAFANSNDDDRAVDILDYFVELLVENWMNGILSIVTNYFDGENNITNNIPIITGLFNAFGGFGEESIFTDILNSVFQLNRESDYSFTFTDENSDENNKFTGLSKVNAYFLITNIPRLIEVINNLIAHFSTSSAGGTSTASLLSSGTASASDSGSPAYSYAKAAQSKAKSAVASYSSGDLSNVKDLINNLDKMLSSLLSDSSLNGFSLDTTENIVAGIVSLLDKFLGSDVNVGNDLVNKAIVLLNQYLYFITGESKNLTPDGGDVNPKKVYTNDALTGLVVETYSLIERLAESLLADYSDSYDNNQLTYNLLVEAIDGLVAPDAVSIRLTSSSDRDYSNAQEKIASYSTWTEMSEASSRSGFSKLKIDWDFKDGDKEGFFEGFLASLRLVTTVIGVLLIDTGLYDTVLDPVMSAMCYKTGVEVTPYEELVADYEKTGYYDKTLIAVISPVTGWLDALLKAPVTTVIQSLQGFAGLIDEYNSEVGSIGLIIVRILKPIANEINGLGKIFGLTTDKLGALSPTLSNMLTKLEIEIAGNKIPIMDIINAAIVILSNTNIVSFVIDLLGSYLEEHFGITLKLIDFGYVYEATPEAALVYVLEYVLDLLLNENLLNLLSLFIDNDTFKMIVDLLTSNQISGKDILNLLDRILEITDSPTLAYWTFAQYLQKMTENFTYPLGITKAMADEGVDSLDNIVEQILPLLGSLGLDIGGENLKDIVNNNLFTNSLLTQMATGIYGALESALSGQDPAIASALNGIGFVYTTKDVAKLLTDKSYGSTFSSAAKTISAQSSWSKVKNINWGFTDGTAKAQQGFVNALAAILRPFNTILNVLLGEGSLQLNNVVSQLINSLEVRETKIETIVADGFGFEIVYSMKNGVFTVTIDDPTRERSAKSTLKLDLNSLKDLKDLKIEGTNAYNSAIIPLLEALQCSGIKTYSQYKNDVSKAKDNLLLDILNPLIGSSSSSLLNKVIAAPFRELTTLLPNIAMYLDAHGLSQLLNNLLAPVTHLISDVSKVIDVQGLIEDQLLGGQSLGSAVADLIGVDIDLNIDLTDLSKINIEDQIVPIIRMILKNQDNAAIRNLKIYDIDWNALISLGTKGTYTSRATGADGKYLTGKIVKNVDNGKVLITTLRYVAKTLVANMSTIKNLVLNIDAIKSNSLFKSIISSVFNTISMASPDELISAIFYLIASEPTNAFWDYTGYKTTKNSFSYPSGVDVDFLKNLPPMLDGLIGGMLDLNTTISDLLFKDEIITRLAKGLYGAVEGVKINGSTTLTQLLSQTGIDFSTTNVANLLVDKSYGQTYKSAAEVIRSADSWSKVDASALKWGVTDRDSFFHALVAVLRPLYGVLDVLLNDASLGLFDIVYIPGSNGYTSSIVPLMEAFSLYNVKTQYQYRQDINKEYDAILLDIINPIWDLVEDVLAAPLQTVTKILPNLALFIGNNGLIQIIENLLTPISALIDSIRPVIDVNSVLNTVLKSQNINLNKYLGMVGITNFSLDLYNLDKTLKPILGVDALIPIVNNALGLIDINGTKIDLKLNDIDWLKLASHGKTVVSASQAATYGSRIYVEGDASETLIAVLAYLIETINAGDNYEKVGSLISGLIGDSADDTVSGVISQVLSALKGDTDTVIVNLVELLQTLGS